MRYLIAIILLVFPFASQASDILHGITIAPEKPYPGRFSDDRRKLYGSWKDFDKDKMDTRQEVLFLESDNSVVTAWHKRKIKVVSGRWWGAYSNTIFTDPSDLDIDHMVPVLESWQSGGHAWTKEKRVKYYNWLGNPQHLIAVSSSENRSKSSDDPADWMPTKNPAYYCTYIMSWVTIKREWGLTVDQKEAKAIRKYWADC